MLPVRAFNGTISVNQEITIHKKKNQFDAQTNKGATQV